MSRRGSSSRNNPPPCSHERGEALAIRVPKIFTDGTASVRIPMVLCAKCRRPYREAVTPAPAETPKVDFS